MADHSHSLLNRLVKLLATVAIFLVTSLAVIVSQAATFHLVSQVRYPTYPRESPTWCESNTTGACQKFHTKHTEDRSEAAWLWCLLGALLFPELLTLLKSTFIVFTRHVHRPPLRHLLVPLVFQTVHCVGICLLFFVAMPGMSVVKMAMVISSISFIPALFKACSDRKKSGSYSGIIFKGLDIMSLLIQTASIGLWTIYSNDHNNTWSVSLGLLLTSFGWWEAYLPYDNAQIMQTFFDFLRNVRDKSLHKAQQHVVNMIISMWKIVVCLVFFLIITAILKPVDTTAGLFHNIRLKYTDSEISYVHPSNPPFIQFNETLTTCNKAVEKITPYVTYPDMNDCSAFWLRVCMAKEPTLEYFMCPGSRKYFSNSKSMTCFNQQSCCEASELVDCAGRTNSPECRNPDSLISAKYPADPEDFADWAVTIFHKDSTYWPIIVLTIQILSTLAAYELSYFAFETRIEIFGFAIPMTVAPLIVVIALKVVCNNFMSDTCFYDSWVPASIFFSCSDELFADNWFFILTFLAQMWISSHIWTNSSIKLAKAELIFDTPFYDSLVIQQSLLLNKRMDDEKETSQPKRTKNIKVFGCATMWHETDSEMMALIDSFKRIDLYLASKSPSDEDYFEMEMHIFFDNAFETDGSLNSFVHMLIELLKNNGIHILEKSPTPYGGKLIWSLKEGTALICHLKDREKVRIKKRWSQLMYFTYFSGQDTMERIISDNYQLDIDGEERENAQNTFLLALDGDVRFQPDAIVKLVDLMKRDEDIGAACGRIHPIGSGLIAMYQKFEYSVGHWLQKSTEDVLGNVLCSPGCFSLIRLNSLLESNTPSSTPAILEYAKVTTTPQDYIQHDQGEDRWLCTLLIERGWKIEYCALSDSYTACPETFSEFYNQRRRWTPSTVANLLELISQWNSLLKHGNLSVFHLIYQILMLTGSAIGPGSIFILLVGGFQMTFDITYWDSFFINVIPILIFVLVSIFGSANNQIVCAKVLSMVYGLSMMAIVLALLLNIGYSCPWAPSTVSLELTVAAFILVGLLHPYEFHYLFYGVVYYLTIPCMYMLLPFYCVFNLDDRSWGTRETNAALPEKATTVDKLRYIFNPYKEIETLRESMTQDLGKLREAIVNLNGQAVSRPENDTTDGDQKTDWTLGLDGYKRPLDTTENQFWNLIISNYLSPLNKDSEVESAIKVGLSNLRNELFLLFLFLNAGWAFGIFLLQVSAEETSNFTIDWVLCEVRKGLNDTMPSQGAVSEYMPLDPINLVFILFFIIILLIQVFGMILHRIGTIGHIVASTSIFSTEANQDDHDDVTTVDGSPVEGITNPVQELDDIVNSATTSNVTETMVMSALEEKEDSQTLNTDEKGEATMTWEQSLLRF